MCVKKESNIVEYGYWVDKSKKMFKRYLYTTLGESKKIIPDNITEGIFRTVLIYSSMDIDESEAIGDLYFDFDSKDNFELAREDAIKVLAYLRIVFKIEYDIPNIYFSGNKGVHITIPYKVLDIKPNKIINVIFKNIADNAYNYTKNKTLDKQIYDKKRLFRLPNTKHEISKLYKVQLTYDELKNLTYDDILVIAKNPRKIKPKITVNNTFASNMYKEYETKTLDFINNKRDIESNGTLDYTPPCIESLIENGSKEGLRNNSIAVLASFYRSCGKSLNEAENIIYDWNTSKNSPPTDRIEVNRTVLSIYSSNKSFGCSKLKTLSECDSSKCILMNNRR